MADLARVKSNIQLMIDQGAQESDIDAYVAAEGTSAEELRAFTGGKESEAFKPLGTLTPYEPTMADKAYDFAKSIGLPAAQMRKEANVLNTAVRGAANGMTFNGADHISALARSIGGEQDYSTNLQNERQQNAINAEVNPIANAAGSIAGSTLGIGKLMNAGVTTERLAANIAPQFTGGLAKLLRGAGVGAADGALYQAASNVGNGQDVTNGVGLTAALGAGAPIVGAGVKKVLDATGITQGVSKGSQYIMDALSRQAAKSGVSPDDVISRMAGPSPYPVKVIDALGPEGSSLARNARDMSREAKTNLEQFAGERMGGAKDRLMQDTLEAGGLSNRVSLEDLLAQNSAAKQPAITKAYEDAKAAGYDLPYSPFEPLMQSPTVKKAVDQAQKTIQDRIALGGKNENSQLAVYNEAKKILDGQGRAAMRTGEHSDASGLAKLLRETVDNHIPEYAGARALAQDKFGAERALELGYKGAAPKTGANYADELMAASKKYPNEVPQGFATGMADRIAGTTSIDQALGKFTQSMDGGAALKAALGPRAKQLEDAIARERNNMAMSRELTGGSQTARLLMESGALGGLGAGLGYYQGGDLSSAGMGALAGAALRYGKGKMADSRKEKIGTELSRILLGEGSGEFAKIAARGAKSNKQQEAINNFARMLLISGGAGMAGHQ